MRYSHVRDRLSETWDCAKLRSRLDQNLLGSVLREVAPPDHSDSDVKNPGLMTTYQFFESMFVSSLGFGNEFFVRRVVGLCCYLGERGTLLRSNVGIRKIVRRTHTT